MKVTLVGACIERAAFAALCSELQIAPSTSAPRELGGRTWLALEIRREQLTRLARRIERADIAVLEVEMPLGGRGRGLTASYSILVAGSGDEESDSDLTDVAKETLHEWLTDSSGGGFDEENAALEFAWELATHELDDGPLSNEEDEGDSEEDEAPPIVSPALKRAAKILDYLVAQGQIELGGVPPVDDIAHWLAVCEQQRASERQTAACVYERLMFSSAVDEVFLSEEDLEAVLREVPVS